MAATIAPLPSSPAELLKTICDQTRNSTSCEQTLKSDPRTKTATNVLALANIALKLAIKDTIQLRDFIKDLALNNSKNQALQTALRECTTNCDTIVNDFNSALHELKEAPDAANYDVMVVLDEIVYCMNGLPTETDGVREALDARFKHTEEFVNIGDVLTNTLWSSSPPAYN